MNVLALLFLSQFQMIHYVKKKIEIKFTTKLFLFFFAFMFIWFYIEVSIISYKLAIRMAPNIFPLDIT